MRAYELMVIFDSDLDDVAYGEQVKWVQSTAEELGATVHSSDSWGKRRFAYEINHKAEGYYVVLELLAEPGQLDELERGLRLADPVVRHKLIRLPDHEAERRGLFGATAADAG